MPSVLLRCPTRRKDVCAMRHQLVQGLLSEQAVAYDDTHHKLRVGLYLVQLSITQYTLVMALVFQRERWILSRGREPLFVDVHRLMQLAQLSRPLYVRQHLFRASERLAHHDIVIGCLSSYGCYAIFPKSELPPANLLME